VVTRQAERGRRVLHTVRADPSPRWRRAGWLVGALILGAGVTMLVCALTRVGPQWLDLAGAVVVSTCYTMALALRTGGRPVVFGALTLAIGLVTVLTDTTLLPAGAAVLTAVGSAVLAVMATVPAVRFRTAVREVLVATAVSAVGALAVVGFRPRVALDRFEYLALALALALCFVLVYRLGAGLHGLGRRGVVGVVVGGVLLAVTLAYAEMLRRYGAESAIDAILEAVRWFHDHAGAVPRPLLMLVGIPALIWGCHMRARRRQGWWVCAFGAAGTVTVAGLLMNPATSVAEAGLVVLYSLPPGLALGYLVIRADLLLTGPRGGARARREEEQQAVRPEPRRLEPLF
jgi:hypothetical protein